MACASQAPVGRSAGTAVPGDAGHWAPGRRQGRFGSTSGHIGWDPSMKLESWNSGGKSVVQRSGEVVRLLPAMVVFSLMCGCAGPQDEQPPGHHPASHSAVTGSLSSLGPPARSALAGAALTFDAHTASVIAFGAPYVDAGDGQTVVPGDPTSATWIWTGEAWTPAHPAQSPPPRAGASLAYDPMTQRVVLAGGSDTPATHRSLPRQCGTATAA